MPYQYPRQPSGDSRSNGQDIWRLWEDLWALVEALNVKEQEELQNGSAKTQG